MKKSIILIETPMQISYKWIYVWYFDNVFACVCEDEL